MWCFYISVIYPKDFKKSNLLWYPHVLYSSNICKILLYNRQLVVLLISKLKIAFSYLPESLVALYHADHFFLLITVSPGFIYCLMFPSLSNFRSKGKFLKSRSGKNVVNSLQLLSKRWYFPHMDRAIVGDFIWKIPVVKVFHDRSRTTSGSKSCDWLLRRPWQWPTQLQVNFYKQIIDI